MQVLELKKTNELMFSAIIIVIKIYQRTQHTLQTRSSFNQNLLWNL